MPYPDQNKISNNVYNVQFANLSAGTVFIPLLTKGRVTRIAVTVDANPTTTATVLTPSIDAVQMQINGANATITIPTTNAAGTVVAFEPTGRNVFYAGSAIRLASNGASANAATLRGFVSVFVDQAGA